eukprot:325952-Hanusia_phi.AAC.1
MADLVPRRPLAPSLTTCLVLLPDTHSVHALMSRAAHHEALRLEALDLVGFQPDLSSPGNTLPLLNVRGDGSALTCGC